jgi:hypothetical protein
MPRAPATSLPVGRSALLARDRARKLHLVHRRAPGDAVRLGALL